MIKLRSAYQICILFFYLFSVPSGAADNGLTKTNVNQLVELIMFERVGDSAAHSVVEQGIKNHNLSLDSAQRQEVERDVKYLFIRKFREKNGFRDQVAQVYLGMFTPAEIDKILQFFSSEVGQKFVKNERQISAAISTGSDNWTNELLNNIDKELLAILERRGISVPK